MVIQRLERAASVLTKDLARCIPRATMELSSTRGHEQMSHCMVDENVFADTNAMASGSNKQ